MRLPAKRETKEKKLFTRYQFHFSFHIGLVSNRIGLLFTRALFHFISDWPPVALGTRLSQKRNDALIFFRRESGTPRGALVKVFMGMLVSVFWV